MLSGIDLNQFCFMSKKHVLMANLRLFLLQQGGGGEEMGCSFFTGGLHIYMVGAPSGAFQKIIKE